MNRVRHGLVLAAVASTGLALLAFAVAPRASENTSKTPAADGINRSAIDPGVQACENFYRHACGGFIKAAVVDEDHPNIALADQKFDGNLDNALTRLFNEPDGDPELQRLKIFYSACLASAGGADQTDTSTIEAWLARIDAAQTRAEIQALMRDMAAIGADAFFNYGGRADRTDWGRYRGEIHNTRLWADATVVERAFVLAGQDPTSAKRDAQTVAEITQTLKAHAGSRWDSASGEHPLSPSQLLDLAPAVDWPAYLTLVGAKDDARINVTSPDYLRAVDQQLTTRSSQELQAYLRWTFLLSMHGELPRPYSQAFGDVIPPLRVALGDPKARCRESTVRGLGVEFSRQFAIHVLGWDTRETGRQLSQSIRLAIVASIADRSWLSPRARAVTAAKLAKTDLKIGFPDHWPQTGDFVLSPDHFLDNVLAARRFEQAREWRRVGKVRSTADWEMKVYPWAGEGMAAARLTIPNGYPDAFSNSMIMTAAFLMPPHLDPKLPTEVNYATFGTTLAHEMVHVAQQHAFDADGRDAELWSAGDQAAAKSGGQCVIDQANAFHPLPSLNMDGEHQFEENVADLGGLRLAYQTLRKKQGAALDRPDKTGVTPAKRFFYAYAQAWCTAQTDASLRAGVSVDGHAPPEFRVNNSLSNLPAFAQTFHCAPHAKMVRPAAQQCLVW